MDSSPRHLPWAPPRLSTQESLSRAEAFHALVDARRSVRFFSEDPVPRALIERAIAAASTAPSGAHRQPWRFVAISEPATKARLREAVEQEEYQGYEGGRMPPEWREAIAPMGTSWQKPYLEQVPWVIVLFAISQDIDPDGGPRKNYYVQESVGIAAGIFITAIQAMGLSTLTHTPSPMRFLSTLLERPANERPFMLFPVGYAAPDCTVPELRRKALDEVSVWVETPTATGDSETTPASPSRSRPSGP